MLHIFHHMRTLSRSLLQSFCSVSFTDNMLIVGKKSCEPWWTYWAMRSSCSYSTFDDVCFVSIWVRKCPARLPMSIWLANWFRKYPPSHVSLSFWLGFSRESQAICPDIFCSWLLSLPIQRRLVFHPDYHCRLGGTSPYVSTRSWLVIFVAQFDDLWTS